MTETLPFDFLYSGDFPLLDKTLKLTPIKDGVLLYELKGMTLIGQIFFSKKNKSATVSIADSKTFVIAPNGEGFAVMPYKEQDLPYSYEIFGPCRKYAYTLFEYKKGVIQPRTAAQVKKATSNSPLFMVTLNEQCNIIRNLLIVVAINGLIQKENNAK